MGMGHDHRIHILKDVAHGHGQVDRRISNVTIDGRWVARHGSLFCEKRVEQEGFPCIFDLDSGIADLSEFYV
jgi:hypothetical protein